jgi:hypothetical protein
LVQRDSTMGRTLVGRWMTAACIAAVVLFAATAPSLSSKNKRIADLSRRVTEFSKCNDEFGSRVGDVMQRMDDGAERANDCLYGVARCRSARWKSIRDRLDKFNTGLGKVGNTLDQIGDKLQTGIVTK